MRFSWKVVLIATLFLLVFSDSGFATGAQSSQVQDDHLNCFQKTLGIVNAEREDHAPTLFSEGDLFVLLPAVREHKKGFYLFTHHSAYFQPVMRPQAYFILKRPGHQVLKFSVERASRKTKSKSNYQVTQYPTDKIGVPYSKVSTRNLLDSSARAVLSQELQKRMDSFLTDLTDLESETKRLRSAHSFVKARLDNINDALKTCGLIKKDAPLHLKIELVRKKLDQIRNKK